MLLSSVEASERREDVSSMNRLISIFLVPLMCCHLSREDCRFVLEVVAGGCDAAAFVSRVVHSGAIQ